MCRSNNKYRAILVDEWALVSEQFTRVVGCVCVQGSVVPARGGGQFVPGVSGIRGDMLLPLLDSVLAGMDGNHCMFITTCKRLLKCAQICIAFFSKTKLDLNTPVEQTGGMSVLASPSSSNCYVYLGLVPRAAEALLRH